MDSNDTGQGTLVDFYENCNGPSGFFTYWPLAFHAPWAEQEHLEAGDTYGRRK
jgi:hypothetical protein